MATLALPLLIAGTAISAMGAIQSANSNAAAMQSQAGASRYNAEVSRQQGDQALAVSSAQQMQQRREARQLAGRQRAAAAQSGVGFGGSNADMLERTDTLSELDALNIAYEGALKARGYNTQAELDEFNAGAYEAQAKSTKRAGVLNAIGTVATGAYMARGAFPATPKTTVSGSWGRTAGSGGTGLRVGAGAPGVRF